VSNPWRRHYKGKAPSGGGGWEGGGLNATPGDAAMLTPPLSLAQPPPPLQSAIVEAQERADMEKRTKRKADVSVSSKFEKSIECLPK
jgi:hypothetical protein